MKLVLALTLAGAALAAPPPGAQPMPLTVGGDYAGRFQAWLTRQAESYWDKREREIQSISSAAQIRARQEYVRKTMFEIIGGLPARKTPLNPRVTGRFERDGYRVENVIFESLPGFKVTANLYIPTNGAGPFPAVLGVAGHSTNGKAAAIYQSAFIGFAKQGFVVLAFDPPGQGERLEYYDPDTGKSRPGIGVPEHIMAGLQCQLTGGTFAHYEIWDGVRAFDYLLTRAEVDPKRIAVAGNSGGGTQAAYLAFAEPRLAAVVSSCYMTRWRELWSGPGPQDAEQIFPGFISKGLDFGDFALAWAPRPFIMTTAIRDFFPIDGARATYKQNQRLFDLLAAADKAGYFEYDDTHGWSKPRREAAYRFLAKWLQGREIDGTEPAVEPAQDHELNATESGQLSTSGGSETVHSLNLAAARSIAARRPAASREVIRAAIGLQQMPPRPAAKAAGELTLDGLRVEKLELPVEGSVPIAALLVHPATGRNSSRAVVFTTSFGKQMDRDILQLANSGSLVLVVDPRGSGESYLAPGRSGYTQGYQLASRAVLLGRNLTEMQVSDLISARLYLQARPEAQGRKVVLIGKGALGPAALLAAALDLEFSEVALERSILTYMDLSSAKIHSNLENVFVPGVLKHFDMPDAIRLLDGRRLTLISPAYPNGRPMLPSEVKASLGAVAPLARLVIREDRGGLEGVFPEWVVISRP